MLEFLIDNIFVMFGGRDFQRTVGIPMDINCVPVLAELLLYSYGADFIQGFLKKNEKKLDWSINFTFGYIDDVLSLNTSRFGDFVYRIYPNDIEIKDSTDTDRSVSYLDLHLEIDSEGRLRTKFYDKRDYFNFAIVIFPFICSNIPAAPAYGVDISQLIRYSRACGFYQKSIDRWLLLTRKLLNQGFLLEVITSKVLRSPPWLGWPLWNICCITNDHGYVPLVVNTSRFFPHSRLITGFVTRLTRRVSLVEQEMPTHPEHLSSSPVFSGFHVTRSLA